LLQKTKAFFKNRPNSFSKAVRSKKPTQNPTKQQKQPIVDKFFMAEGWGS
jgi:hypothetical protein